jgi:hypothetical protein
MALGERIISGFVVAPVVVVLGMVGIAVAVRVARRPGGSARDGDWGFLETCVSGWKGEV